MLKYLKYKFDRALEKSFLSLIFFLFFISLLGLIVLSIVFYLLYLLNIVSVEGKFLTFLWSTFIYFIDVGTIAAEGYNDNTGWDRFLKIFITIFGVIIFSTFIGIISQALSDRVDLLRSGNGNVRESNHIIIFGFSRKLIPLLQELFQAFEDNNYRKSILVVSELLPLEASNRIESSLIIPKKINLVFRTGYPWQKKIPKITNLKNASNIILLKPDINQEFRNVEDCDIEVGKGITTILGSKDFNRDNTNVICEFFTKQKSELYYNYVLDILKADRNEKTKDANNKVIFLEAEDCRANLITQAVNTPDILEIYDEIFSYKGSEIYFIESKYLDKSLYEKLYEFNDLLIKELNANLFKSICIGTFSHDPNYEKNSKLNINIEINPKNTLQIGNITGFIFIAHDKKEIFNDISSIDRKKIIDKKIKKIEYLSDNHYIKAAIITDNVKFNRVNKIINKIIGNKELNINEIKIFHDDDLSVNDIENLHQNFDNKYFAFDTEKINLFKLRNESRYPYENVQNLFSDYNKIICIYDEIIDEDDNINNIKDNKVIDTFKLLSFLNKKFENKNNIEISFITEVGGFKTKQLLESNRKYYYNPFFGEDIIDLNSISSKIIASGVIDPRNTQLINSFLDHNQQIKNYTISEDNILISFDELERFFAEEKNEILLGIIDYDISKSNHSGRERKKINQIIVNPDQREVMNISKGDRIITLV